MSLCFIKVDAGILTPIWCEDNEIYHIIAHTKNVELKYWLEDFEKDVYIGQGYIVVKSRQTVKTVKGK